MSDLISLPADTRARVNVIDAAGHKTRYGAVVFRFDTETQTATLWKGETLLATAVVTSVEPIGSDAYQTHMVDGTQWVVLAGGCGCGGG